MTLKIVIATIGTLLVWTLVLTSISNLTVVAQEQFAPGKRGEEVQADIAFPGQPGLTRLSFSVIEGWAVWQGDIVLGKAEDLLGTSGVEKQSIRTVKPSGVAVQPGVNSGSVRWPDGIVPYEIDGDLASIRGTIIDAATEFSNKTNVTLIERTNETAYLRFVSGSGCASALGRTNREQFIRLDPSGGCSKVSIMHEIGHTIGLFHEQARNDRDNYIRINWENISDGFQNQFTKASNRGFDIGTYDCSSIMHYGTHAFSMNGQPTIVSIDPNCIIQRGNSLSPGDIAAVNRLYPSTSSTVGEGITQEGTNGLGTNEAGDKFGAVVATGDFNNDGFTDLAVGAPGEAPGADPKSGTVFIFNGIADGDLGKLGPAQGLTQEGLGANEAGDKFGTALATGDFNRDGFTDLAVGAPGEAIGSTQSGAIFIFNGSPSGLQPAQGLDQRAMGANEAGDKFGAALATGDFNRDGFIDLAVGAPGEAIGSIQSGAIFIFNGSSSGLQPAQGLDQEGLGANEAGDKFGTALTAGDFNGDGFKDLAVGAPGEAPGSDPKSGYIFIFNGSSSGLQPAQGLDQAGLGANEAGDKFGTALTAGDFNGDGFIDLAVGAPGEAIGSIQSGVIFIFNGSSSGLQPAQGLDQNGIGANETGDRFGTSLTAGDFNGDRIADLAVGAPGEAPGADPKSGYIFIFKGTRSGLQPNRGIDQKGKGNNEAGDEFGTALAAGDFDNDGAIDLVVGAPGEAPGSDPKSGAVFVYAGSRIISVTSASIANFEENRNTLNVQAVAASISSQSVTFNVNAVSMADASVYVYNLNGNLIFDSGFQTVGHALRWNLLNTQGQRVANGVYLYVVTVRGYDGKLVRSEVKKMVLLR